jgi:hypothetical protein
MSSTYDLVEQDFIHEIPISTSNIQNEGITVHSSENDLVVYPHIVCRILPTPVCKNNLL